MSNNGNDTLNQQSVALSNNNDNEHHNEPNIQSSIGKSAAKKINKQDKFTNSLSQHENQTHQSALKSSNFVTQEIPDQIVVGPQVGSEDKVDPAEGSKNHEEPEPESLELKPSQDDGFDQNIAQSQQPVFKQSKDQVSAEQDQNTKKPALFNDSKNEGHMSPNHEEGYTRFLDRFEKAQTQAKKDTNFYSGHYGNSQTIVPCASVEQMSGEEAEVNEIADSQSPRVPLENNQHDTQKSNRKLKKSPNRQRGTGRVIRNQKFNDTDDDVGIENKKQDAEASISNDHHAQSSMQSRMQVDVQSRQLHPYLQEDTQVFDQDISDVNRKNSEGLQQFPIGHSRLQPVNQSEKNEDNASEPQLQKSVPSASCTTKKTQKQPEQEQEVIEFQETNQQEEADSNKFSNKEFLDCQDQTNQIEQQIQSDQKNSNQQEFESAQDKFMDEQEWPKEKYLEANQATDTDKEFDQQIYDKQDTQNLNNSKQLDQTSHHKDAVLNQDHQIDYQQNSEQISNQLQDFNQTKVSTKKSQKKNAGKRVAKKSKGKKIVKTSIESEVESNKQQDLTAQNEIQDPEKKNIEFDNEVEEQTLFDKVSPQRAAQVESSQKKKGKNSQSKQKTIKNVVDEDKEDQDHQKDLPIETNKDTIQTKQLGVDEMNLKLSDLKQEDQQLNKIIDQNEIEQARGRRSTRRNTKNTEHFEELEARPMSTRKTRSALKAQDSIIQPEGLATQFEDQQPSTGKQTKTKKGKNTNKKSQKNAVVENLEELLSVNEDQIENLDNQDQIIQEKPLSQKNETMEIDDQINEMDQIIQSDQQSIKVQEVHQVSAIVDMDQVQQEVQNQNDFVAHQQESNQADQIQLDVDHEEPKTKIGRPKSKKKKSQQKKKPKGRAKKSVQQPDQFKIEIDSNTEQQIEKPEQLSIEVENKIEYIQEIDLPKDQNQNQVIQNNLENLDAQSDYKPSRVADPTQSLSQQKNSDQEFIGNEIQNNDSNQDEDFAQQQMIKSSENNLNNIEKVKSEEEMPKIGLLEDPNQDEFDYVDIKKDNSDKQEFQQQIEGDLKKDDNNAAELNNSQDSSAQRYVEVPHQDDPNDSEFMKSEKQNIQQFNHDDDSSIQDDIGLMAKDINHSRKINSITEESPRQNQPKQSDEFEINNDLGLVLEDDQDNQLQRYQEQEVEKIDGFDIVNKLMTQENQQPSIQDENQSQQSLAKHSNQGPIMNVVGGFADIDLNDDELSKSNHKISEQVSKYQSNDHSNSRDHSQEPQQLDTQKSNQEVKNDKNPQKIDIEDEVQVQNQKKARKSKKKQSSKDIKNQSKKQKSIDKQQGVEQKRITSVRKNQQKIEAIYNEDNLTSSVKKEEQKSEKSYIKDEQQSGFHGFLQKPVQHEQIDDQSQNEQVFQDQQIQSNEQLDNQRSDQILEEQDENQNMQIEETNTQKQQTQNDEKVRRKAQNEANQFINIASKLIQDEYGSEDYGEDDEEEGEFIPPSQDSSESLPSADDSKITTEEIQIGEQVSHHNQSQSIIHKDDISSKKQQTLTKKKASPFKQKSKIQRDLSQKSIQENKLKVSKIKNKNANFSQNIDDEKSSRGRLSRSQTKLLKTQSQQVFIQEPHSQNNMSNQIKKSTKVVQKSDELAQNIKRDKFSQKSKQIKIGKPDKFLNEDSLIDNDKSTKQKQSNKQSFFIERISRKDKFQKDSANIVKESKSPKKTKTETIVSKLRNSKTEKISPRKTRGRTAQRENQNVKFETGKSTQRNESISDEIVMLTPKLKQSKQSKQSQLCDPEIIHSKGSQKVTKRGNQRSDIQMNIESDFQLHTQIKSSSKLIDKNDQPIIYKKTKNQSIIVAEKTSQTKQKYLSKTQNQQHVVKEQFIDQQIASKSKFSPLKTRSGPRGVVKDSPSKISKNSSKLKINKSNSRSSIKERVKKNLFDQINKNIMDNQDQVLVRDKSKDTTKKTSEKPSKASKQMHSKAEMSLGLMVAKDINQNQSKESKNTIAETKKSAFGFMDLAESLPPQIPTISQNQVVLKKRGRPRKDNHDDYQIMAIQKFNNTKQNPSKKIRTSHSAGLEVQIKNDDMNKNQNDSNNELNIKKRGRPKKIIPNQKESTHHFKNQHDQQINSNAKKIQSCDETSNNQKQTLIKKSGNVTLKKQFDSGKSKQISPRVNNKRNLKTQQKAIERNNKFVQENLIKHKVFDNMFVSPEREEPNQPLGSVWTIAAVSPKKSRSISPQKLSKSSYQKQNNRDIFSKAQDQKTLQDLQNLENQKIKTSKSKTSKKESGQSSKQKKLKISDNSRGIKKQRGRKSKDGLTMAQRKELIIQKRLEKKAAKQAIKQAQIDAKLAKKNAKLQKKLNMIKQKELKKRLKKEKKQEQKLKIKAEKLKKKEAKRKAKELKLIKEKELAKKQKEQKKIQRQNALKQIQKEKNAKKQSKDFLRTKRDDTDKKLKTKTSASADQACSQKQQDLVESKRKKTQDESLTQKKANTQKQSQEPKSISKSKINKSQEKQKTPIGKDSKKTNLSQISCQKSQIKSKSKQQNKQIHIQKTMQIKTSSKKISKKNSQKKIGCKIDQNNLKQNVKNQMGKLKKNQKVIVFQKMSSSKNILKQKDFEKNSKSSKLSSGKNSIVKNKKQNDLKKNLKNSKSKNESQKSSLSKQAGKRIGSKR